MTLNKTPPSVPYPSPINKLMPHYLIKSSQSITSLRTTALPVYQQTSMTRWQGPRVHGDGSRFDLSPHPGAEVKPAHIDIFLSTEIDKGVGLVKYVSVIAAYLRTKKPIKVRRELIQRAREINTTS